MIAILNTVIDPPDLLRNMDNDEALEEDLSINEMESVVEVVLEQGLDIENAMPETDDPDSENFCKKVEVLQFFQLCIPEFKELDFAVIPENHTFYTVYFSSVTILINSPPPKV